MHEIILKVQRRYRIRIIIAKHRYDHNTMRYVTQRKRKDHVHFGTNPINKGPLESVFGQLNFKPMVFGMFGVTTSNVKDFDILSTWIWITERSTWANPRRHQHWIRHVVRLSGGTWRTYLCMSLWRGYANFILDCSIIYMGDGIDGLIIIKLD
jgi:hypothetical protein